MIPMKTWKKIILPIISAILLLVSHRLTIPYANGIAALITIALFVIFQRSCFHTQSTNQLSLRIILMEIAAAFSYAAALSMAMEGIDRIPATWKIALEEPVLSILDGIHPLDAATTYLALPIAEELIFRSGLARTTNNIIQTILLSLFPFTFYCYLRSGTEVAVLSLFLGILLTFVEEVWQSTLLNVLTHIAFLGGLLMAFANLFLEGRTLIIAAAVSLLISAFLIYALYQSAFEEEEDEDD